MATSPNAYHAAGDDKPIELPTMYASPPRIAMLTSGPQTVNESRKVFVPAGVGGGGGRFAHAAGSESLLNRSSRHACSRDRSSSTARDSLHRTMRRIGQTLNAPAPWVAIGGELSNCMAKFGVGVGIGSGVDAAPP